MKVSLAAQTLSASVASAIDFLRDEQKIPEFEGSEATTKFIRIIDKAFDMLNSGHPLAKAFKAPVIPSLQNVSLIVGHWSMHQHGFCVKECTG